MLAFASLLSLALSLNMAAPIANGTETSGAVENWSHPAAPGELCGNLFIFRPCTEGYVCTSWYDRPGYCGALKNKGSVAVHRDDGEWVLGLPGDRCGGSSPDVYGAYRTLCGEGLVCQKNHYNADIPGVCIKQEASHA